MPDQAHVSDTQAFAILRQALHKFKEAADQALTTGDADVARTQFWLETEQTTYWQVQLRKRTEAVVKAREAVRQKKLYKDATGRVRGAVEEEKALAKCMAALQQAEEKVIAVKKALPRLQKGNDLYRGGVARLKNAVAVDITNAIALLDRLAENVEQYVQIEAPGSGAVEVPPAMAYDDSMARPAGEPPTPGTAPAAESAVPDAPPQAEGGNVADRQ